MYTITQSPYISGTHTIGVGYLPHNRPALGLTALAREFLDRPEERIASLNLYNRWAARKGLPLLVERLQ